MYRIPASRCLMSLAAVSAVAVAVAVAVAQEFQPPQPSPEHEGMAREVGEWDADVTMWHTPGGQPMKSKGAETNKMLGQFWLLSEFTGDFGGMKYTGNGQFGYNPVEKKCVGTWIDTFSPYMQTMEGNYDETTHTLTMTTEGLDFMTGKIMKGKNVTTFIDDNTKKFEMYGPGPDGKQFKMMEIMYKRRS